MRRVRLVLVVLVTALGIVPSRPAEAQEIGFIEDFVSAAASTIHR